MTKHLPYQTISSFMVALLTKAGVASDEAVTITHALLWADQAGRPLHGISRIPIFLQRFQQNLITSPCHPEIIPKTDSVTLIDGHHGFGPYLGVLGIREAVHNAERHGLGLAAVKHSNHFGAAAYYVNLAAENGHLAWVFSNSFPKVAPAGSNSPILGTNPLAFAAPRRNGRAILIDLATSALAGATVRDALESNTSLSAQDVTNQILHPLGGAKGFALGLMVEILGGVLTGAGITHEIASIYKDFSRPNNVGHLFISLKIEALMPLPHYFERVEQLVKDVQQSEAAQSTSPVRVPGALRWAQYEHHQIAGIPLSPKIQTDLKHLANSYSLECPW